MTFLPEQFAPARRRPFAGRPARARRRGQALVEFALILPILLLVLVIAIDFGRLFYLYVGINNGAREGAAYGADKPPTSRTSVADITTRVRQELGLSATDTSVAVTMQCSPDCYTSLTISQPHTIRVTASTTFSFLTPGISTVFGGALPMSAASTAVIP